jgi:DnaJ family protein A protein 2
MNNSKKFNPYNILEVEKTDSVEAIRKQYKKKALKLHPDKGGDPEEFQNIQKAYEILSDVDKKRRYDDFGISDDSEMQHSGMGGMGGMGGFPFGGFSTDNPFEAMFNRREQQQSTTQYNRQVEFEVSLEHMYLGKILKLKLERKVLTGDVVKCDACKGSGRCIKEIRTQFMCQRMESACPECSGNGVSMSCAPHTEIIELNIKKGCKGGDAIIFKGKGNIIPNGEYGDLVFVLKEKKHSTFIRSENNLVKTLSIGLVEALCGFDYEFVHLDGRKLRVAFDDVIHPSSSDSEPYFLKLEKEGMPINNNNEKFGDLFIKLDITFPKSITNELKETIRRNLKSKLPDTADSQTPKSRLTLSKMNSNNTNNSSKNKKDPRNADGPSECAQS